MVQDIFFRSEFGFAKGGPGLFRFAVLIELGHQLNRGGIINFPKRHQQIVCSTATIMARWSP